jgi:hypothetical protein
MKYKSVSSDVGFRNILGRGNVTFKVVMCKKQNSSPNYR